MANLSFKIQIFCHFFQIKILFFFKFFGYIYFKNTKKLVKLKLILKKWVLQFGKISVRGFLCPIKKEEIIFSMNIYLGIN